MSMPMVKDIISAAAMHWIRRALFNQEKVWAKNIIADLQKVGGISVLGARVDISAVKKLQKLNRKHVAYLLGKLRELQAKLDTQVPDEDTALFHNEEFPEKERGQQGIDGLAPRTGGRGGLQAFTE